ncbi:MAG: hypothetical protein JW716_05345 [Candidatus Aenigmarchaeota archaeon]|nr:hypothetical protein [Candidatus Aenigmarchaeota archaeon]
MEGIIKEIDKEKNVAIIAAEDENDYEIELRKDFEAGDVLSFEKKKDCIDCSTIKKTGHINLEELEAMEHHDCASCGKCCGF